VYKVRGDESGAGMHQFPAQVIFLDDSAHRFCLDKKAKGADLLNLVFQVRYIYGRVYTEAPGVVFFLPKAKEKFSI
jgi:hypothetical protein